MTVIAETATATATTTETGIETGVIAVVIGTEIGTGTGTGMTGDREGTATPGGIVLVPRLLLRHGSGVEGSARVRGIR